MQNRTDLVFKIASLCSFFLIGIGYIISNINQGITFFHITGFVFIGLLFIILILCLIPILQEYVLGDISILFNIRNGDIEFNIINNSNHIIEIIAIDILPKNIYTLYNNMVDDKEYSHMEVMPPYMFIDTYVPSKYNYRNNQNYNQWKIKQNPYNIMLLYRFCGLKTEYSVNRLLTKSEIKKIINNKDD